MALAARVYGWYLLRAVFLTAQLCVGVSAHAAQPLNTVAIHAEKQGSAVAIEARVALTAPLPLIWQTLTDYDRMSSYIPGMRVSRIVERRGPATIIKQQGEAGFLFFMQSVDVVVESLEKPPYVITVRVLSGNLKQLDGRYQIEPDSERPGQFVLHWFGLIEPETSLPPLIGVPILRSNIRDQFRGLVREIERRTAENNKKIE